MYYNRTIQEDFAKNLMVGGQLRWLFDYVKSHSDLDLLTVKIIMMNLLIFIEA